MISCAVNPISYPISQLYLKIFPSMEQLRGILKISLEKSIYKILHREDKNGSNIKVIVCSPLYL